MINKKLAKIFDEFAKLLEINEVPFKPAAYEKAARAIENLPEDIGEIYKKEGGEGLLKISSVGKGIAEKIAEYIKTGKIKDFEKLKKKLPINISELEAVEGVGPKLLKIFYDKLKIKNIGDLEKAAREGKLAELPRLGEKLQKKILKSVEFRKKIGRRFLFGDVYLLAKEIEKELAGVSGVKKVSLAGSFRRGKETVGDLDFLVALKHGVSSKEIMNRFVSMPGVEHVYGKGGTKSMVRFDSGLDADLRVVEEKSFGAALQYFTGSKEHNVALREMAKKKELKLNEYGIFSFLGGLTSRRRSDLRRIAGETEGEVYKILGLKFIPPELRESKGEIEAALKNSLPKLVELQDIRGDLQIQTKWTDGENSMEEYAREAEKLGYEYILITDHTKSLAMTGGLDESGLLRQMSEIEKMNSAMVTTGCKLRILSGAEINILKDGSLDIKDEVLGKLDIAAAAMHSHFHLSRKEQTKRLIKAMENPHIDIIFHPTTRIINQRPEIDLDLDAIFSAAARTGTILEINAFPSRLDLKDEYIARAREKGVKFTINTDSHSVSHLQMMKFGITQARRGWCEKSDVINTLPFEEFIELFRKPKNKRL